ncbi:two-component system, OmpR family, sensor histidine kinase QseC [Izhakiella capsodis]|uniref:Sensor protein QseC n=1 Tax=Izhakiella capsodis TaxID=1367852 RepID=A0A1I4ZVR5_9GAMM|nr:quorum sensing histidine kinase QseC [Izhakiella capsodis]SFN54355.1 two-component system, OmpR family, sensor histidine kinase QseC [Izhakiella capsodis]
MKKISLRLRLVVGFILIVLLCGGTAALLSWLQTRENINELFDTQQLLFARRLATLDPHNLTPHSLSEKKSKKLLRHNRGNVDDDVLAFAIFTRDGKRVADDGDHGREIGFEPDKQGFSNSRLINDDDRWRIVWLDSADYQYRIAVGQKEKYREEMTADMVSASLYPWLYALPLMVILLFWLLTHELSPLRRLTYELEKRSPDATHQLKPARIPKEVFPLVQALNGLFSRTSRMISRERGFISDAAHELRSPLAALRVQAEVAQLSGEDASTRTRALNNLTGGIGRASRLVDQLLALSRLDNTGDLETAPTEIQTLLRQAIVEQYPTATQAGIQLSLEASSQPVIIQGDSLLLSLLMRNLLDNAIRYGGAGGEVQLLLSTNQLKIIDNGPGIDEALITRIEERFFRPPGQKQQGSGLGLSIVRQIAQLHNMKMALANRPEGGLCVTLSWT